MRTVIRPHLLLDVVTGDLLPDRAVVIDGHRIAGVVAAGDAPAEGPAFVDLPEQTVLPGMIDCHTHLIGDPDSGQGYTELLMRTGAQEVLSGVRNARDTLLAGFTTVRDVGTFRAFMLGSTKAALTSRFSLSTISVGVSLGTPIPYHVLAS